MLAHGDRLSSPSGDPGDTISRRLVNSPSGPPSSTPTSGPAYKYTGPSRLYPKQEEIRAGPDSGSPVSRNPFTSGLGGSFPSRVQSLEIVARARHLSSLRVLTYSQVSQLMGSLNWASGLIPLGLLYLRPLQRHFHSLGLTDRFTPPRQSEPLVLANLLRHWQDLCFLISGIPIHTFQADDFYGRLHPGVGRSHGGFPEFVYLDLYSTQAPNQLSAAQGGSLCPKALGSNAPGPPGFDHYGQFDSSFVYQQARRDPFPHLVTFDSRASPLVIIVRARHIPGCLNVIADHLSRPNRPIWTEWSLHPEIVKHIFRLWGTPEVDMFATVSNSHLPRFMSPVPEPRALAVNALSQDCVSSIQSAQQSHSEALVHPGAETVVVSTPTSSLCGSPPVLSLPSRSSVPAGSEVCLGRKVVPSARMEALMLHYKAAGFSDEVSRLAAAPKALNQSHVRRSVASLRSLGRRARV